MMITFPNSKINIGLNIIEKRKDGFHNIESVFYPVQLTDALEVIVNTDKNAPPVMFTTSGIAIPGNNDDNLCCKAYHLINADYPLPSLKIHLHKHIPVGAGLGGGSADAAFFIKQVNEMLELNISWGEQHHYARRLGSDCSFFITNKPVFAEGRGDEYERISLDLSGYFIVLVYPHIIVNTGDAYNSIKPAKASRSLEQDIAALPIEQWKEHIHNDFEKPVFAQYPQLSQIKKKLYAQGALYASMSGSGSAVYGIFDKETDCKTVFTEAFVWEGKL